MLIPGNIISAITFPGVIVHEWAHKIFCKKFNVKVLEVKYWSMSGTAYVRHEEIKSLKAAAFISLAPFIVNTSIAILIGVFAAILRYTHIDNSWVMFILGYLAVSIGMHAFPSKTDTQNIVDISKRLEKKGFYIIAKIFDVFFWIMRVLSFAWLDFVFGILLFYLPHFLLLHIDSDFNKYTIMKKNAAIIVQELNRAANLVNKSYTPEMEFPVSIYETNTETGTTTDKTTPYNSLYMVSMVDNDSDRRTLVAYTYDVPKPDCEYIIYKKWKKSPVIYSPNSCDSDESNIVTIIRDFSSIR